MGPRGHVPRNWDMASHMSDNTHSMQPLNQGPVASAKRELEPQGTPVIDDTANRRKIKRLNMLTKRVQHAPSPQPQSSFQAEAVSTNDHPNYSPSGLLEVDAQQRLLEEIGLDYKEPSDACTSERYRFYTFEDHDDIQGTIILNQKSKYSVGSDPENDIVVPGLDPHHALIQIRQIADRSAPSIYLVDLGSTGGTALNSKPVEKRRFVELVDKDTVRFKPSAKDFLLIEDV